MRDFISGGHDFRGGVRRKGTNRASSFGRIQTGARGTRNAMAETIGLHLRHFWGERDLKWVSLLMWAGGRPVRWSNSGKGIHGRPGALYLGIISGRVVVFHEAWSYRGARGRHQGGRTTALSWRMKLRDVHVKGGCEISWIAAVYARPEHLEAW